MALRIIGAGLGRTGTTSLKSALEHLLQAPCYHMEELFLHPEHVSVWRAALRGEAVALSNIMEGYAASVDWPAGACWRELSTLYPDAPILLSVRATAEEWWKSADETIFEKMRLPAGPDAPLAISSGMIEEMMRLRFTPSWNEKDSSLKAYDRHNADVRSEVEPSRLIEWKPTDGWEPLCRALGVPIPSVPFPHKNSAKEFRNFYGWEP